MPKTTTSAKGTSSSNPSALGCAGGSCLPAGSVCVAADEYGDSSAFVTSQSAGHWKKPQQLTNLVALDHGDPAGLSVISCSSPGNCVGGGYYDYPASPDFNLHQGLLTIEKNGKWGKAQNVPGLNALNTDDDAEVTSISCPAAGYCTAAGYYSTGIPFETAITGHIFTVEEKAGKWQPLKTVPGTTKLGANPDISNVLVSCSAPGTCGLAAAASANTSGMFATADTDFKWGAGQAVKGMTLFTTMSCGGAGSCTAIGGDQLTTSSHGTWSTAKTVGTVDLNLTSVACGGPGDCVVGGSNSATLSSPVYAFVKTEHKGTWDAGGPLPGLKPADGSSSSVNSLACSSSGNCAVGGAYGPTSGTATVGFVSNLIDYKFSQPQKLGHGGVGLVTCSASSCGALLDAAPAVAFQPTTGYFDFSQKRVASATSLTLAKAKVAYGSETAEKLTVVVSPATEGPATGTVTITSGKVTLCRITLESAKGSCKFSAKGLKPGTYVLIAGYPGDKHYRPSVSPARKLIITA